MLIKETKSPQHVDGLVQDCSISITNAVGIMKPCTKPSMPLGALLILSSQ